MSKFVFKTKPDREIKVGDSMTMRLKTDFGIIETMKTVDEEFLKELVDAGVVIEKECSNDAESEMNIFHVICHLAERINWKPENLKKYLENLYVINPVAVYQTLLKEIAIIIDSNYSGHITTAKRLWAVDAINGEVFQFNAERLGNLTNVALFRTPTEAKLAKKVLMLIEADIF